MELALSSKDILKCILNFLEPHKSANFANVNKLFNKIHKEVVKIIYRGVILKNKDNKHKWYDNDKIYHSSYRLCGATYSILDKSLIKTVSYGGVDYRINSFNDIPVSLVKLDINDEKYYGVSYHMTYNPYDIDNIIYTIMTSESFLDLDNVNDKDVIDILFER